MVKVVQMEPQVKMEHRVQQEQQEQVVKTVQTEPQVKMEHRVQLEFQEHQVLV